MDFLSRVGSVPYNFRSFPSLDEVSPVDVMMVLVALGLYAPPAEDKYERHADIAYRTDKDADKVRHTLDVYVPKGKKDFPTVLFVHGGSWKSGNKNLYAALGQSLAADGIGCVICNYRLSPAVQHPAHVEDAAKAFAWTCENIGKYGGSKERLFLCGHSAGGHIVSLLATDPQYLKAERHAPGEIRGVCSLSGVYEIVAGVGLFDKAFGKDKAACKAASPLTHANGKHPPFFIAYADQDIPLLDVMAENMRGALKKAESPVEVIKCKDRTHYTIMLKFVDNEDPLNKAFRDFVKKNSK
jgi:carboxylesterase type B